MEQLSIIGLEFNVCFSKLNLLSVVILLLILALLSAVALVVNAATTFGIYNNVIVLSLLLMCRRF